jgi:hypothetical protein
MRILFSLVVFCWVAVLPAQDAYFARLAGEVCSCMERFSVERVHLQATNCLREVALANEESLRIRYNLMATEASQRDLLADRLAEDLVRDCPLLATLNYDTEEEFRWSDRDRPDLVEPMRFRSAKDPPADPAETITGEPPTAWLAEGKLERMAGGKLLLRLTSGDTMELEYSSGIFRPRRVKTGEELKLSFRREWRKEERRIINVVLEVKE